MRGRRSGYSDIQDGSQKDKSKKVESTNIELKSEEKTSWFSFLSFGKSEIKNNSNTPVTLNTTSVKKGGYGSIS